MKKRLALFGLCIFICIAAISCRRDPVPAEVSAEPVIVTPSGGGSAGENLSMEFEGSLQEDEVQPKIDLPSNSEIIQIVNENLDIDQIEEQIIAYREKDLSGAPIRLLVADYDAIQDSYFPAWESGVDISNAMSFSMSFIDLVGDHVPEIVCTGTNPENGNQLLRVFRKEISPSGFGLHFSSISSLSVRGSIEIVQIEREQAYYNGQKNGKSFPIVSYEQDQNSDNLSDLIKTSYYWRYQENSYAQVMREQVQGERIEDERLNRLFRSNENDFEAFLQGPWLKASQDASGRVSHSVLYFQPESRFFANYSGDVQEEYIWQASNRTNYNQLYIIGANDLIRYIRKQLSITVRDIHNIHIWTSDINDTWSGEYQRISGDVQSIFFPESRTSQELPFHLSGVFTNESGVSVVFDEPRFQYRDDGGERNGGYALYYSGAGYNRNLILELVFLSDAGLIEERRVYKLDYLEEQREQEIIRTLYLIPGRVGVRGFVPDDEGFIQYEQIETIDTAQDEAEGESDTNAVNEE